jgi:hypothetical protein
VRDREYSRRVLKHRSTWFTVVSERSEGLGNGLPAVDRTTSRLKDVLVIAGHNGSNAGKHSRKNIAATVTCFINTSANVGRACPGDDPQTWCQSCSRKARKSSECPQELLRISLQPSEPQKLGKTVSFAAGVSFENNAATGNANGIGSIRSFPGCPRTPAP